MTQGHSPGAAPQSAIAPGSPAASRPPAPRIREPGYAHGCRAARKKPTERAAWGPIPARRAATSSPNSALTSIGNTARSRNRRAISGSRSGVKADETLTFSDAANSPSTRVNASVGRSRPMRLTLVASSGNLRASAIATRMSPIVSGVSTLVNITAATASSRCSIEPPGRKSPRGWCFDGPAVRRRPRTTPACLDIGRRLLAYQRRRPRRSHRRSRR